MPWREGLLDRIFDVLAVLFWAIFGGAARAVISPKEGRTFGSLAGSMIVAAFAGILVHKLLSGANCPEEYKAAGVGVAGLLADDLLSACVAMGKALRADPMGMVDRLLDLVFKGRRGGEK